MLTNEELNTKTDDEIFGIISQSALNIENSVELICKALVVLRSRNVIHHLMNSPLFRKFHLLGEGRVTASAYLAFSTTPSALEGISHVDRDMQDRLAADEPLPCVVRNAEGRIVFENKPVRRMEDTVIKRVFGPEGIRSREDQEHILAAEMKQPTRVRVSETIGVIPRRDQICIGRKNIYVDDMREPLRLLGYKLVKIEKSEKRAA